MFKKNKIDKIIIAGQTLRKNFHTIKWIYNIFQYFIKEVTDLPVYYIADCSDDIEMKNASVVGFNVEKFYNFYSIDYKFDYFDSSNSRKKWAEIYYNKEYNKEAYEYIHSIYKNSLVINYETEECIENILNYYNIEHIDLNLDSIRFLDDIMLCFKTNNKKIYNELLKYKLDEKLIYLKANYISSVYKVNNNLNNYSENNVLFLGQTICDKTLVDKKTNEIYSILNHKEEFLNSINGFDNVYYKRHPQVYGDEYVMEFISSIDNIKIIDDNFYKLLSRPDIKKVVSISSGSCSEAKYFGKNTQTLLQEGVLRQTENKFNKDKYVSIYQDTFSLNFWADILRPIINTKKYNKEYKISFPNMFRHTTGGLFYSYEDFNFIKNQKDTLIECDKKIQEQNIKWEELNKKIKKTIFVADICNDEDWI